MEIMHNNEKKDELLPSAHHHAKPMLAEVNFARPVRVQRKRTKGWRMPENTVSVCRPTKWGNPFKLGNVLQGHEMGCSDSSPITLDSNYKLTLAYEFWIKNLEFTHSIQYLAKKQLKGKNLACFCSLDKPCHADILLKIANSE